VLNFLYAVGNTHTLLIYVDDSTTIIVKSGPVDDFLLAKRWVIQTRFFFVNNIDWAKVLFFLS
jgi:hypothetical protein